MSNRYGAPQRLQCRASEACSIPASASESSSTPKYSRRAKLGDEVAWTAKKHPAARDPKLPHFTAQRVLEK